MYSSNPFPHLPSSTNGHSLPNSFFFHEKERVHDTHHQKTGDPFNSGDFLFHACNTSAQDFARQDQEGSGLQNSEFEDHHSDLLDSVVSRYKKRITTSKKDGHSKIYTAQGPRDRRVRLSIDISRKFFCLQDLLGFDKASKTLDWLFSKSLNAIKELVDCSSSKLTDQSKVTFLETINGGSSSVEYKPEKNNLVKKRKTRPRSNKSGIQENLARDQSRAEARARARERTREKLLAKKLDADLKTLGHDGCKESAHFGGQTDLRIDHNGLRNFKVIYRFKPLN